MVFKTKQPANSNLPEILAVFEHCLILPQCTKNLMDN